MFATHKLGVFGFCAVISATPVAASTFVPPELISPFGGLVVEAEGFNGTRLFSQTAASDLNKGAPRGDPEINDFFIGQQTGFDADLLAQLGGGFLSFSVRLTLFDGDNDPGNFDFNDNLLRVNDVIIGNFSDIVTTTTDAYGTVLNGMNDGLGFGNDETDTGRFTLTSETALAELYASFPLTNTAVFEIDKLDPSGNWFDFTSPSRIPYTTASIAPTTIAPVPLSSAAWFLLAGLGGLGLMRRRPRA